MLLLLLLMLHDEFLWKLETVNNDLFFSCQAGEWISQHSHHFWMFVSCGEVQSCKSRSALSRHICLVSHQVSLDLRLFGRTTNSLLQFCQTWYPKWESKSVCIYLFLGSTVETNWWVEEENYLYIYGPYIDIAHKHIPSTNQTWQRKIPYRLRWFSDKKIHLLWDFKLPCLMTGGCITLW